MIYLSVVFVLYRLLFPFREKQTQQNHYKDGNWQMNFYKWFHLFKRVLLFNSFYVDRKKAALKAFISINILSKADPSIFIQGEMLFQPMINGVLTICSISNAQQFPLDPPLMFGASEIFSWIKLLDKKRQCWSVL